MNLEHLNISPQDKTLVMEKNSLTKQVILLLVILIFDQVLEASSNSFDHDSSQGKILKS